MPQTTETSSASIAIKLDCPQTSYVAGSVIHGRVVRRVHTVSAKAVVTIGLLGRTKTKITEHHGQNTSTYRGRFTYFDTHQTIYAGPLHIPPKGEPAVGWPFSFTLPHQASLDTVLAGSGPKSSILPLRPVDIATQPLPASFHFDGSSSLGSKKFHGFVEYYLTAKIVLYGSQSSAEATLPIHIRPLSSPFPITNLDIGRYSFIMSARSNRLDPTRQDKEPSFWESTKAMFHSSEVPVFSYVLQIDFPRVIQLANPIAIPFRICVLPRQTGTSAVIRDVPQTVTLTELNIKLKSSTNVYCSGLLSMRDAGKTFQYCSLSIGDYLPKHGKSGWILPSGKDGTVLDVGAMAGLRLDGQRPHMLEKDLLPFPVPLWPTFTTYNIKHSYMLTWTMTVLVADVFSKQSFEHAVTIMAPSEEQERQTNGGISAVPILPPYSAVVAEAGKVKT